MSVGLVIRADADKAMGTGHVMRCLALAEAWRGRGGDALFVGKIEPEPLRRRIVAEGHGLVELAAPHPDPADRQMMSRLAGDHASHHQGGSWLALDGYHFDDGYQRAMAEAGWRLLVVDDLRQLDGYCCEVVLNQNSYGPEMRYPTSAGATLLLGPRYALLRGEFRRGAIVEPDPGVGRRVLITMGGADQHNVTAMVLSALAATGIDGLEARAVLGAANPHAAKLAEFAAELPFHCELLHDVTDMAGLMRWADAAVTAAGTTTYELAALGTPFMTIITADNQEQNAAWLERHGVAVGLGWFSKLTLGQISQRLRDFLENQKQRRDQARRGMELVDGRGAERVVLAMLARGMVLRKAGREDSAILLSWANDPESRANSFSSRPISLEEHEKWLNAKLASPDCRLWLASMPDDSLAGMVRFDLAGDEAEISVNLAPAYRGQELGSRLIGRACAQVFQEEQGLKRIVARIKAENRASLRAFASAGFITSGVGEHRGATMTTMHLGRESHG
ncbi:MAG: UDP-2,4-diacetamido-2,4,6-trideoxy-beta-L-altropyranose hydrolase [Thermodesulfobacteriota bacterium]